MSHPAAIRSRTPLLLSAAAVIAACSGSEGGGTTEPPEPELVASAVSLTPQNDTLTSLGQTLALQLRVEDQFGDPMDPPVAPEWSSSAPSVASVSAGTVEAVANGSATITVTVADLSADAPVEVEQRPAAMSAVSGDGQSAEVGEPVTEALIARVSDARGHPIAAASVQWSVVSGGGELTETGTTTGTDGTVSARWRLGSSEGGQTVRVSGAGISVDFSATATAPDPLAIDGLSPAMLEEGAPATISGTALAGAAVLVDGVAAEVLSSAETSLTFTVPVTTCRPSRSSVVRVQKGGEEASRTATVRPANRIPALAFGEIWMSTGSGDQGHCLPVEPQASSVRYLIGIQSLVESATAVTPSSLRISSSAAVTAPAMAPALLAAPPSSVDLERRQLDASPATGLAELRAAPSAAGAMAAPRAEAGARSDAHLEMTEQNLALMERLGPPSLWSDETLAAPALVAAPPTVGQQMSLRVPDGCDLYTPINATVKAVGSRAVWLEDNARPAGGFTDTDYADLATLYDDVIGAELDRYLGAATDVDSNGLVLIVVTPEVNARGNVDGFVNSADFLPRTTCPSSDVAEILYVLAPDPGGATPRTVTVEDLLDSYPPLIAHEMTHVIHIGNQIFLPGNPSLPVIWEAEGFATLLEQLVGHAFSGLGSGQNLGYSAYSGYPDWYRAMFSDLAYYFGFESSTTRVEDAPHGCSWLGRPPNGSCLNAGRMPYGVPASLYRWIADFAWTPATESEMTRAVVQSTKHGFDLLGDIAAEDTEWVMALWAVALVADDVYFGGGGPTFSSWNLGDVFGSFFSTAQPTPATATYDFTSAFDVRGGSTAYFEVSGAHPELAIAAENLPETMRLWIVRVQ